MNRTLLREEPRLRRLVADAMRRAKRTDHPVLVSLCRPVDPLPPLDVFARGREQIHERFFWDAPAPDVTLVGLGAAATLTATGRGRFAAIARQWARLTAQTVVQGAEAWATGPLLMGGFAFMAHPPATGKWSGFPGALLVLPRMLWTWQGDRCWLTVHAVLRPEDDAAGEAAALARCWTLGGTSLPPPNGRGGEEEAPAHVEVAKQQTAPEEVPADWRRAVAAAMDGIQRGEVEKVVLARELQLRAQQPLVPSRILQRLQADRRTYQFAVARGKRCFLGATPERLVRLQDGQVAAACLAGSKPRGATTDEDEALAHDLLTSDKERREHDVVVRALQEALGPVCSQLTMPPEPGLLRLKDVQHLLTPVEGRVPQSHHILELVARLHPTPAVAGFPRRKAVAMLDRLELLDRGWYAGVVGWLDARGRGEFSVAIRSGLVAGQRASLYAGCGIVAGSDPEQEYAESRLKFRAMLTALEDS